VEHRPKEIKKRERNSDFKKNKFIIKYMCKKGNPDIKNDPL